MDNGLDELRFPVSFECDKLGSCPRGWTCNGSATVCGADVAPERVCRDSPPRNMRGERYLSLSSNSREASAASPVFMLPDGAHQLVFSRGGSAHDETGLSLHMATNAHQICRDEALQSGTPAEHRCVGLSLHTGQGVYILLRSTGSSFTADDIRLLDQQGEDIKGALVIPGVTPKLPHPPAGPEQHAQALGWIDPPAHCCEGERPSIITYAGKDKMAYIDGAVMLGLSLQWHVPEFARLCLVIKSMSLKNRHLLEGAGWLLVDIEEWHPDPVRDHFAHDYWWDSYNKIDVFRVKVSKVLWLDADMYIWNDSLRQVLEGTELPKDSIAMVEDCTAKNFNSGLMLFEPNLATFRHLRSGMSLHTGWSGLDQPLINKEYKGRITKLDAKFNAHGSAKTCKGIVAAHYTGRNKPTLANVENLRRVSKGYTGVPYSLRCPKLYEEYFCAMKNARNYLSDELQAALQQAGNGHSCP